MSHRYQLRNMRTDHLVATFPDRASAFRALSGMLHRQGAQFFAPLVLVESTPVRPDVTVGGRDLVDLIRLEQPSSRYEARAGHPNPISNTGSAPDEIPPE